MKLTKLHLFLIIMVVLLLSTLGFSIKEYFDGSHTHNSEDIKGGSPGHTHKITLDGNEILKGDSEDAMDDAKKNKADPNPDPALQKGSNYDPFKNNDTHDPLLDNDYSKTIAGLEDIVVPGRGSGRGHHNENGDHLPGAHGEGRVERKMERKLEKEERKLAQEAGVDMSKYILKSEIVPPVCPKCPDSRTCPREKPAPPCPPCARCPEPAFECKKVPNYSAIDAANAGNLLPMPRLNSFAQFN